MNRTVLTRTTGLACVLLSFGSYSAQAQTNTNLCWMRNFSRGAGTVGAACGSGQEKDPGGLCYPVCQAGYTGVGPVCWQGCPAGFTDIGVSCQKPQAITSAGYPWKPGDPLGNYTPAQQRCLAANPQGCFQDALIWYPNCPSGYANKGDNTCSPVCPAGMTDAGAYCTKNSYGRGVGTVPTCGTGVDDAGLCYPACPAGSTGVGPTCWSSCPSNHPYQCGAACAVSQAACAQAVGDMVLNTTSVAINLLSMAFGGPGVTTAIKDAATAGEGAVADVVAHTAQAGETTLIDQAKVYTKAAAKQFLKTMQKNGDHPRNQMFNTAKKLNKGALKTLNEVTKELGVSQQTSTFNLNSLTALDPTGIASMVTTFTQYGSCNADDDFTVSVTEGIDLTAAMGGPAVALPPALNGLGQVQLTLTAQNPMTVTSVTSGALTGCALVPTADCIGQSLQSGQTCHINVIVNAQGQLLNGEIRVYTDDYSAVPYPIAVVGNLNVSPNGTTIPQAPSITDGSGVLWTVDDNGLTYENGVADGGANIAQLVYFNNNIYAVTTSYSWFKHVPGGWLGIGNNDPRGGITIPSTTSIKDKSNVVWTLDASGKSYENGVPDGGANLTELVYYNGTIYGNTTSYGWYVHNGGWAYYGASDPRVSAAPPSICQANPYTDEAVNLTSIAGTWAINDDQSKKLVVQTSGRFSSPAGSGVASIARIDWLANRAFSFAVAGTKNFMTLDESGDHLTGVPTPGQISVQNSGLVLDITGGSTADGALLEQWGSNGGQNQFFTFVPQADGAYAIQIASSQKMLEAQDPAKTAGNIIQATPTSAVSQEFRIEPVGDESQGWYRIVSVFSGQYLTVANASSAAGASIVQAPWAGTGNQQFKLPPAQHAVRRQTGAGCPNGQTLFDGLCYDVAPGQNVDSPGLVGSVCPDDWRDDGTSCWPPWAGVAVPDQADPQGSFTMRHPIVVTSCSSYSAANRQSCPTNFTNVGGTGSCSCQAQPKSRNIQVIGGSVPSN